MRRSVLVGVAVAALILGSPGIVRAETAVAMKGSRFVPKDVTVRAGETVVWTNHDTAGHSVAADDGSFDSHPTCGGIGGACMRQGDTFRFTFSKAGPVRFYCRAHGAAGGQGMAGTVNVTG